MAGDHFAWDAGELDREFLEQVEASHLGGIRCLTRGEVLHWQGDPVEYVFAVRIGSLKEYTLLPDSRAYAYRVRGAGGLAGATAYLLGHDHDTITQALDEVQVIALQPSDFDRLLTRNPRFSSLLIKKLAQSAQSSADKARDLGFLDVQQRLKRSLPDRKAWEILCFQEGMESVRYHNEEELRWKTAQRRSSLLALDQQASQQPWLPKRRALSP